MTTDLGNMTYEERLRELDLFSLAKRWGHKSSDRHEIAVRRWQSITLYTVLDC